MINQSVQDYSLEYEIEREYIDLIIWAEWSKAKIYIEVINEC